MNSNAFIESQYIYFEDADFIVNNGHYFEDEEIIYKEYHDGTISYTEWKALITGEYLKPQILVLDGRLTYIRTVQMEAKYNIINLLNEKRLESQFRDYEELQQAELYCMNSKGERLQQEGSLSESLQQWMKTHQETYRLKKKKLIIKSLFP